MAALVSATYGGLVGRGDGYGVSLASAVRRRSRAVSRLIKDASVLHGHIMLQLCLLVGW